MISPTILTTKFWSPTWCSGPDSLVDAPLLNIDTEDVGATVSSLGVGLLSPLTFTWGYIYQAGIKTYEQTKNKMSPFLIHLAKQTLKIFDN